MTTVAIGLVVASAFAHAGWNFIAKRGPAGPAYTWVLVVSEAIAIAPLGIILIVAGHVDFSWTFVWVIVLAGALQAVYFMLLRAGYAPVRNWVFNATYFINDRNVDVGTKSSYDRLQLDMNLRF